MEAGSKRSHYTLCVQCLNPWLGGGKNVLLPGKNNSSQNYSLRCTSLWKKYWGCGRWKSKYGTTESAWQLRQQQPPQLCEQTHNLRSRKWWSPLPGISYNTSKLLLTVWGPSEQEKYQYAVGSSAEFSYLWWEAKEPGLLGLSLEGGMTWGAFHQLLPGDHQGCGTRFFVSCSPIMFNRSKLKKEGLYWKEKVFNYEDSTITVRDGTCTGCADSPWRFSIW